MMQRALDWAAPPLFELMGIGSHDLVSITGAGGKTTLAFLLCGELAAARRRVLVTTTTKMFYPVDFEGRVVLAKGEGRLDEALSASLEGALFAASGRIDGGKVKGFESDVIDRAFRAHPGLVVLNEADGAAQKPCKFYRDGEPVVPVSTTVLVHVVGSEVLGRPMSERLFHRCPEHLVGRPCDQGQLRLMCDAFVRERLCGIACRSILVINKADDGREQAAEAMREATGDLFGTCIVASLREGRWHL